MLFQDNLKSAMGSILNGVTYIFLMRCSNSMLSYLQRYIAPKTDGLIREIARKCFKEHGRRHLLIDNSGLVPDNMTYRSLAFKEDLDNPSLLFQEHYD